MKLLHIDLKQVTGIPVSKLFLHMDSTNKGSVSKKKWDHFFEEAIDANFNNILSDLDAKQPLSQRAQHKLAEIWKRPRGSWKNAKGRQAASESDGHTAAQHRETSIEVEQRKAREGNSVLPRPGFAESVSATIGRIPRSKHKETHWDEQRDLVGTCEDALGPSRSVTAATATDRPSSAETGARGDQYGSSANPGDECRELIREQLRSLGPDEGKDFASLKRAERIVVEEVARELGLWCSQTTHTGQFRVMNEGEEAAEIRRKLGELKSGERAVFDFLVPTWCVYTRQVADSMGLSVLPADSSLDPERKVEVWNLSGAVREFVDVTREQLRQLCAGDVLNFPSTLSAIQSTIVEEIAAELGLFYHRFDDGLKVGNLNDFKNRICQELKGLEAGKSCIYVQGTDGMSDLEMHAIRTVAQELDDKPTMEELRSHGLLEFHFSRPLSAPIAEGISATLDASSMDRDEIKQRVAEVFERYASGRQNRDKVFLRKPDLQRYAEDARRVNRDSHRIDLLDVMPELEEMYDEILELQIDMGSKVTHGLSLDFFQVFLSKSAHLFGWSLISMLCSLLEISRLTS